MRTGLLFCLAIVMLVGVSQGIGIRDYRPPTSSLTDLNMSAFYNYLGQDSTLSNNGSANLQFVRFYESQPYGWSVNSSGGVSYNELSPDSIDNTQYTADLHGMIHKYLSGDFFGYTSLNASSQTGYDNPAVSALIGAGYGRFTNATAMAKALRIQEELYKEGVINSDLENNVMIELASAIDNRSSFDLERGYYAAIQRILESSSRIETLSGVAMYRIMDVLNNEVVRNRYYGYRVGIGIGYELSNAYSDDTQDPVMEIFGNYSHPFSVRSQFNQSVNYTGNLNDFGDAYTFTSTSAYSFELSNKIDDVVQYQMVMNESLVEDESFSTTTHVITNSFIYYIENRIGLNLDVSLIKTTDIDLQKAVGFSITYNII